MDVALAIGKESFGAGAGFTGTINYADFENELRKWFNDGPIQTPPPGNPPGTYPPGYYLTVSDYYDDPNTELWNWAKEKYGENAPMLPNRDLYIDASQMVTLAMSAEFPWWEYDHVYSNATTDHTNHKYYELTNQTTSGGYTQSSLARHIILANNGATLRFEGYHVGGYCDFAFLPNTEATRKVIEYGVQEDGSAHAFGGNGFFFNCHMNNGIYGDATNPQKMNGYLIYFQYNGYRGERMLIYKFKDVNTKTLHQATDFQSGFNNGTANFTLGGGTWTCVAQSTVYNTGGVSSTATRGARRIKIEIDPQYVRVWHKGVAVTNATITNTPFADYQEAFGEDPDSHIIGVTNNATTGWVLYNGATHDASVPGSISLDPGYISVDGYGFGPMASYNSHNCSEKTIFTISNLTMSMGSVRKLHEVVADPHWHDNTKRVLVNLNLQEIEDFSTPATMGDLLSRVINDNIYYIGWCSAQNVTESQQFANASNPKGTLVNAAAFDNYTGGDPTSVASRKIQMKKIAQAIYDVWYKGNVNNQVLVTDDVNFTVEPAASGANTAEPDWPDGKWKFVHKTADALGWEIDQTDPDNTTLHPLSNKRMSNLDIDFTYPGEYDVYYRDVLIKTITAHRKPVANFKADISNLTAPVFDDVFDAVNNPYSYSYDPDDLTSAGIVDKQWKWTDLTAGTSGTGKLASLTADHVYLIELTVTDKWDATATFAKTLKPVSGGTKEPPMAVFELSPVTVIKGLPGQKIIIDDHSYDDYGRVFTYNRSSPTAGLLNQLGISSTGTGTGTYNVPTSLAVGEYKIELIIKTTDADLQSSLLASRTFWVVEDLTPPTASRDKDPLDPYQGYTTVTLTFDDVPVYDVTSQQNVMSGFKQQWVYVSTTPIPNPSTAISDWGEVSTANNRAVSLPTGNSYVYWKAEDNVGNIGYGGFGPYSVSKFPTPVTLTADPALSVVYGGADVNLTATLPNSQNPYQSGTIEFFMDGVSLGFADIILSTDNGTAPNIYTAYAMFNAKPNRAADPPVSSYMNFEAQFYGDAIHEPGSDDIDYTVEPNTDAGIEIALTLGAGADSKIYDGTGIPTPAVTVTYPTPPGGDPSLYAISYSGNAYDETIPIPYGPNAASPVNVGKYKATARTTSPDYVEKTDAVDFYITPREVTVSVTPPGSPVVTGGSATFTATVGNLVDQPAGTLTFYLDGVPVVTGVAIGAESGGTATATWTWTPAAGGSHDIMAEFVPTAQSNYATNSGTLLGYTVGLGAQSIHFVYDNNPGLAVADEDPLDSYTGQTLASGIVYGGPNFKILAAGGLGSGSITYELTGETPNGGTSCVTFNPMTRVAQITGAGIFYVKATKAGDGSYNAVDTTLLVKIARAAGNVTVSVASVDYLEPVTPMITNLSGGALTYSYSGTFFDGTPYGPTSTPPTQAGNYTLSVTSAPTANYNAATGTATFTINKIPQTIVLNHGRDTTLWTTQTTPFTLPVTGGSGTGALSWNSTATAVATVTPSGGVITLQPSLTPPVSTNIQVIKAGDNNYLPSSVAQITLRAVYQPTTVGMGIDVLPPDFAEATYQWTIQATGCPTYSWSVSGLPAGMTATVSGANNELLTVTGTPLEVFDDEVTVRVTNGGGVTQAVDVPMTVYPAPVASTDEKTYVYRDEEMIVTYPIPMNRNVCGTVTVNGRAASGYWLSDTEFVISPPRDGYDYKTTYTVVISGLKDAQGAIIQYHQAFIFATGDAPMPRLNRKVTILSLPGGVTSDKAPEYEYFVLSGGDFSFTLTVPSDQSPVIETNRLVDDGAFETMKGKRIDDTDSYEFVLRQIRQQVDIRVTLEERQESGNEVAGEETKVWSNNDQLYVETSRGGLLSVYTLTGGLCLQETLSGNARFTLPRGVYVVRLHGETYKVVIY
ncbi:MAG: hypothetical protein LBP98_00935 [Tannerella sp.]|jgi:hypothetical protein|nr:hypothetical protein [Tannerella sp.]